jgi:hypothetical protein
MCTLKLRPLHCIVELKNINLKIRKTVKSLQCKCEKLWGPLSGVYTFVYSTSTIFALLKGAVSRDWGGLQIVSL